MSLRDSLDLTVSTSSALAVDTAPVPAVSVVTPSKETTRTLTIRGATVAYSEVGSGTPVLLVHGSASSRRIWRPLVERLAPRYRVIAPDLFGYGDSAPLPGWPASDLDILAAFARSIGEPFHLVGHSYGGALALLTAIELAPKLASIALIEPVAFHLLRLAKDEPAWLEIAQVAARHLELVGEGELDACADHFMGYWIGARAWGAMPAESRARIARTMPKIAAEWAMIFRQSHGLASSRRIRVPTLLIRGTRTTLASRRVVDHLLHALPDRRLVEIGGAGHMAPLTHADAVSNAIEAHIESCGAEILFDATSIER